METFFLYYQYLEQCVFNITKIRNKGHLIVGHGKTRTADNKNRGIFRTEIPQQISTVMTRIPPSSKWDLIFFIKVNSKFTIIDKKKI